MADWFVMKHEVEKAIAVEHPTGVFIRCTCATIIRAPDWKGAGELYDNHLATVNDPCYMLAISVERGRCRAIVEYVKNKTANRSTEEVFYHLEKMIDSGDNPPEYGS